MKNILYKILISIFILTSCINDLRQNIEGDWIGYKRIVISDNDSIVKDLNFILTLKKDSVYLRNFKYIDEGNSDSVWSSVYSRSDSLILIGQNTKQTDVFLVEYLDENKLIISKRNTKYFHARLQKTNENFDINLAGNIYVISDSSKTFDTIEFVDNKTLMFYNLYLEESKTVRRWRIRDFNGNNLLIIDDPEFPVFLIEPVNKNDFKLKLYPKAEESWKLKKI